MPNIARMLKDEIVRLARKELRPSLKSLKSECAALKTQLRVLKAKLAALEKSGKASPGVQAPTAADAAGAEPKGGMRFNSKTMLSLRQRLGLSQKEMGQLVGVSAQAVYLWEAKGDKLRLRNDTRDALLKLKAMGRRDVAALLAAGRKKK